MGWAEKLSPTALRRSNSSADRVSSSGTTLVTDNFPVVRVPVLSNTVLRVLASASSALEPLTRTPRRLPAPMPAKKDRGIEITRAQGQEATKNTSARLSHMEIEPIPKRGGRKVRRIAAMIIQGV